LASRRPYGGSTPWDSREKLEKALKETSRTLSYRRPVRDLDHNKTERDLRALCVGHEVTKQLSAFVQNSVTRQIDDGRISCPTWIEDFTEITK
jgi:hypothetical protein